MSASRHTSSIQALEKRLCLASHPAAMPFTDPDLVAEADFNNDGRADMDGLVG